MINAIEDFHQFITVWPRLYLIEQVQLRDAVWTEIVQHDAGFCVAMAWYPDPVQRVNRSGDNVPGVSCWRTQFFRRDIPVVRLFDGERRGFNEGGNVPAVLALTT